ncbi:MAG: hypothetical protein ACTSU2_04010 [Promethearchaeota archaeon]
MTKILRDIWIMREGGLVLFKRVFDKKMDAQLFGGLMSALNTFSQELDQEGLSSFQLGSKVYYIIKQNNLIFIANTNSEIKKKAALKELRNVAEKFIEMYPTEVLNSWNGDLTFFNSFEEKIAESIETPYEKLKQSFW